MPPKQLVLKHDPSILLETLHEDDDVLAIAKPFGVLAHPSPGFWTKGTLAHALVGRVANDMMQERGNHNESLPFCFKLNHWIMPFSSNVFKMFDVYTGFALIKMWAFSVGCPCPTSKVGQFHSTLHCASFGRRNNGCDGRCQEPSIRKGFGRAAASCRHAAGPVPDGQKALCGIAAGPPRRWREALMHNSIWKHWKGSKKWQDVGGHICWKTCQNNLSSPCFKQEAWFVPCDSGAVFRTNAPDQGSCCFLGCASGQRQGLCLHLPA